MAARLRAAAAVYAAEGPAALSARRRRRRCDLGGRSAARCPGVADTEAASRPGFHLIRGA
ncbi:MAG: hypothetical protein MZW92_26190 [Comamonadaceae bacterium]|nr:hypothetical protein [Comamonadaceae bacterium]